MREKEKDKKKSLHPFLQQCDKKKRYGNSNFVLMMDDFFLLCKAAAPKNNKYLLKQKDLKS